MKWIILISLMPFLSNSKLLAQTNNSSDLLYPSNATYKQTREKIANKEILFSRGDWQCYKKYVLVNFHFMQDNNGNNNFRATDDGFGNTQRRGYEFAIEKTNQLGSEQ